GRPVHVGKRRKLEHQAPEAARQPGKRGRNDEGDQFVGSRVITKRNDALLVLLDGVEDISKGRMHDARDGQYSDGAYGKDEKIHRRYIAQIDQSEKMSARDPLDAVFAPGPGDLQANKVD